MLVPIWLRRLVRKYTNPIPYRKALTTRQRLGVVYMFLAWNALGLVVYKYFSAEKSDDDYLSPSAKFAIKAGIEKARIVKFQGINRTGDTEFKLSDYKKAEEEVKPVEPVVKKQIEIEEKDEDEFEWNTQSNIPLNK